MARPHAGLLALGLACALAAEAHGQTPGSDFRLNTYTTGTQDIPLLARDGRGNFVAVWSSYGQDGDRGGLFAQRFDRLGAPRGSEFRVNTITAGRQLRQSVAGHADGSFVVVWETENAAVPGGFQAVARRFDQAGAARGAEFAVTSASGRQNRPDVAVDAAGQFVIVWAGDSAVVGRRWDADGNPVGAEFLVSTSPAVVGSPDIAFAPQGGFVVTWFAGPPPGAAGDVFAQRFDAAGARVGGEFRVNAQTSAFEGSPTVVFQDTGAFVIAWEAMFLPGGQRLIFDRLFTASGDPTTPDLFVAGITEQIPRGAPGASGDFILTWTTGAVEFDVAARRQDVSGAPLETAFVVPQFTGGFQGPSDVVGAGGAYDIAWGSDTLTTGSADVLGRLLGWVPAALAVDASPMQSDGNGVLEAGETVAVAPAWINADRVAAPLTGVATAFTGPGVEPVYAIVDAAADYGSVPVGGNAACQTATGDCFAVALAQPSVRPATHWDAVLTEAVSARARSPWAIHVGRSFSDVPPSSPFYRFVETLLHRGVTSGCASDRYCPSQATTREQMAAMVLAAKDGGRYRPPACTTGSFGDVPPTSPFCPFVEELARRGVVTGCGGGNYCPAQPVSREQMAVFVLRTLDPALDPPACGTPLFNDVPASSPFCRWVEELARRAVVGGCGGGNYCPTDPVTREQTAVFATLTFGLTLYGP